MQPPGAAPFVEAGGEIFARAISCGYSSWWLTVYFLKRASLGAIDKPACRALFAHTGKRSPREAACPRIASGLFREGRCMPAVHPIASKTFLCPPLTLCVGRQRLPGTAVRGSFRRVWRPHASHL